MVVSEMGSALSRVLSELRELRDDTLRAAERHGTYLEVSESSRDALTARAGTIQESIDLLVEAFR